jgi:hypothetical protein
MTKEELLKMLEMIERIEEYWDQDRQPDTEAINYIKDKIKTELSKDKDLLF